VDGLFDLESLEQTDQQGEQRLTGVSQINNVVATTQHKTLARQGYNLGCDALRLDGCFRANASRCCELKRWLT